MPTNLAAKPEVKIRAIKSLSRELKERSGVIIRRTSNLIDDTRETISRSIGLLSKPHRHHCMSCNGEWKCEHPLCELKYLSWCVDCNKKLGSTS